MTTDPPLEADDVPAITEIEPPTPEFPPPAVTLMRPPVPDEEMLVAKEIVPEPATSVDSPDVTETAPVRPVEAAPVAMVIDPLVVVTP